MKTEKRKNYNECSKMLRELRTKYWSWTATTLITVMLGLQGTAVAAPIPVYAAPDNSGLAVGAGNLWEELESNGEVVISFPSQIEASIASREDEDCYSFRLEENTNLTISLESEYPCGVELLSDGEIIGVSNKPYSQILEFPDLKMGFYTVRVRPQQGTESSVYSLRIFRKKQTGKMPDYSEAHIAGTIYDPESPFRYMNVENEAEKNKGHAPIAAMHYLAHWQGPVKESVMPYYDKGDMKETPSDYIHYKKAEPEFHGQSVIQLPGNAGDGSHMEHWKNAIMTYGAIDTGLIYSLTFRDRNEGDGYPELDLKYFYAPPKDWDFDIYGGHATMIVGWDDTIEKENFTLTKREKIKDEYGNEYEYGKIIETTMPEHDGAWICRDSYGYDDYPAFYYVSYESANFGRTSEFPIAIAPPEKTDNYNHLYSNSAGGMMPGKSDANGFVRVSQQFRNDGSSELLRSVGFAADVGEVSYEIAVRVGDGPLEKVKSGYLKYPGLYTMRLDGGIMIPGSTDFEVHVALSSKDENKNLSFSSSYDEPGWINGTKKIPGKAFIYRDWDEDGSCIDLSGKGEYPCVYAYTYSPLKSAITLLDNKEKAKGYETATTSNAAMEPEADKKEQVATPSEADRKEHVATPSEAEEKKHSVTTATPSTIATPSETESPADPDEIVLEDDTEETRNAKRAREKWEADSEALVRRMRADGFKSIDDIHSVEAEPLNLDFPDRYDSRDSGLVTKAKHQGASNLCWAFAIAGALETSYLKYGNQMPRGMTLLSRNEEILNGKISLKIRKGQEIPLDFSAVLYSDSISFQTGNPQIYWELTGDISSVKEGNRLSESGEESTVLTAVAPGNVTVTAVSLTDTSLRASCQIEITEAALAKVSVSPSRLVMKVGETQKLETTVEADEELTVQYSSDRPDVVSVDHNGQVLALKAGTAVVTARAGEGTAVCRIQVRNRHDSDDSDTVTARTPKPTMADTAHGLWEQESGGWRFQKDDGTYARDSWERISGLWYYFKSDAYAASGWLYLDGIWYYLNQEEATFGRMETGWLYDVSYQKWFYLDEEGAMATGWRLIDGKWYYFHPVSDGQRGRMYEGERTPDGYMTGSDGAMVSSNPS